jgi:hypothetical protein
MNLIQNIIDTHTVFGVLGQVCFVALAMLILRFRRTGRRFSSYLCFATTLPAILGTVAAYLQLLEARNVMNAAQVNTFAPDAAVRTIFGLLGIGIVSSVILLALCALLFPQKKKEPAIRESPVGSFSAVQGVA